MTRPVIGLPTYHHWARGEPDARILEMRASYCQAVAAAGGAPLLVPLIEDGDAVDRLYGLLDGLLLCGGGDVDASFYGQEDRGRLTIVDPARDRFELALTRRALEDDLPLLAICRGIQVLNVAAGGSLIQHIPSECPGALAHATPPSLPPEHIAHVVTVAPDSRLAAALGLADPSPSPQSTGVRPGVPGAEYGARDVSAVPHTPPPAQRGTLSHVRRHPAQMPAPSPYPLPEYRERVLPAVPVNSRHHQAVERVADGYDVVARAPDGVIEGIERRGAGWVVGVQWHPENMAPADRRMASLFGAFIQACRG